MCDFCKELIKCPVGEKRQVELFGNGEGVDTDAYGHDLITAPLTMYIDKNNKDGWSCGIYQDVYTEDSVHYGGGFSITHCPFCGEKLVDTDLVELGYGQSTLHL